MRVHMLVMIFAVFAGAFISTVEQCPVNEPGETQEWKGNNARAWIGQDGDRNSINFLFTLPQFTALCICPKGSKPVDDKDGLHCDVEGTFASCTQLSSSEIFGFHDVAVHDENIPLMSGLYGPTEVLSSTEVANQYPTPNFETKGCLSVKTMIVPTDEQIKEGEVIADDKWRLHFNIYSVFKEQIGLSVNHLMPFHVDVKIYTVHNNQSAEIAFDMTECFVNTNGYVECRHVSILRAGNIPVRSEIVPGNDALHISQVASFMQDTKAITYGVSENAISVSGTEWVTGSFEANVYSDKGLKIPFGGHCKTKRGMGEFEKSQIANIYGFQMEQGFNNFKGNKDSFIVAADAEGYILVIYENVKRTEYVESLPIPLAELWNYRTFPTGQLVKTKIAHGDGETLELVDETERLRPYLPDEIKSHPYSLTKFKFKNHPFLIIDQLVIQSSLGLKLVVGSRRYLEELTKRRSAGIFDTSANEGLCLNDGDCLYSRTEAVGTVSVGSNEKSTTPWVILGIAISSGSVLVCVVCLLFALIGVVMTVSVFIACHYHKQGKKGEEYSSSCSSRQVAEMEEKSC